MREFSVHLNDEAATTRLGEALAPLIRDGDVIALSGPLGAGKTSCARAIIAVLTEEKAAPSPTFALVESYAADAFTLWHFDLYRLESEEEVWELGLEDAMAVGASLIEWPEKIARRIPETALLIRLDHEAEGRKARLQGGGDWPARLESIKNLAGLKAAKESSKKTS